MEVDEIAKLSQSDIEIILDLYKNGETFTNIAKKFNVSRSSVTRRIKQAGVYRLDSSKTCVNCGSVFYPSNYASQIQRFCSDNCRQHNFWKDKERPKKPKTIANCRYCGNLYEKNGRSSYCSVSCKEKQYEKDKNRGRKIRFYKVDCEYCKTKELSKVEKRYCSDRCADKHYEIKRRNRKRKLKKCKICNSWHSKRGVYCSIKCGKKAHKHRSSERMILARKNGQFDADIDIYKLIERDGGCCYLCGDDVLFSYNFNHPKYPTIEHVVPISKGGTHSWDNVMVACRDCNTRKKTKSLDDFLKGR